jgi:hypothetical protein
VQHYFEKTMKVLKIFLISFILHTSSGDLKKQTTDLNQACVIRFLQIRGKIDEKLYASHAPADMCRILLPLVYANHSEKLCLRLWETKSVKAECVFESLKKFEFIDLELKFEVYSKSKHLTKYEKKRKIYEVTSAQREALIDTARKCRSDYTYGGLFDEILGINSSLIALQKEYCLLKYALENKFLDLRSVSTNPRNIDVSNVQCVSIITQCQNESEERLLEAFRSRKYASDAIACLIEKYKDERIFGWNLAKDLLHKIKIPETVKISEDYKVSKVLSDFNRISSNCLYSFNWSFFQ